MQKIISTIAIAMLLVSCSSKIKQKVRMEDVAPDELQVEKQRPLYVPPHYELPAPPMPQLDTPEVKKKSSWMFWKKDKTEPEQKIVVKSEKIAGKPTPTPKKKWFWQNDKVEATVEHKAKKPATEPKKKPFWKRETKTTAPDVSPKK